jgi:tartrate dehydrogenase/decarboxylase/D-malate dehydrogenase
MKTYKISIIPGDGIGAEVIEASLVVLQACAGKHGFSIDETMFNWSCDTFLSRGRMMPEDGLEQLDATDAILLCAVGWPVRVADNISLHGLLLPIGKQFDLFANVRPHRLLSGVKGPLRKTGFDILCIRENTEGEYAGAGGRVHSATSQEVAVETSIFTRHGVERILRFGFEAARTRKGKLASVMKSNAQKHSMVFWDEVTEELTGEYTDVQVSRYHVDAIAARMITHPESLDVIVASILFGDILSDIGAAIQGGLGFAASANVNPNGRHPSLFEPVHGSAPDIAGKGLANPIATIWSAALMLEHLGESRSSRAIMSAIDQVTLEPRFLTPDCWGRGQTLQVGQRIADMLSD